MQAIDTETPDAILLIGGTDPSGAGLQTDWRVANSLNIPTYSVVTAATAQHAGQVTDSGVLPVTQIRAQLDSVQAALARDPSTRLAAIKIGMLGDEDVVHLICETVLLLCSRTDRPPQVILDPVLCATSGARLLTESGQQALVQTLLPLVDLITPNLPELEALSRIKVNNITDLQTAAQQLLRLGVGAVLVKGGHFNPSSEKSSDYFLSRQQAFWLTGTRWPNRTHTRGTGCMLASAMACATAQQRHPSDALILAKALASKAIRTATSFDGVHSPRIDTLNTLDWGIVYQDMPFLTHNFPDNRQPEFPRCDTNQLGIYPVVSSSEWVKKLVGEGITTIQLRIKTDTTNPPSDQEIEQEIQAAIQICEPKGVRIFINDHWQLALKHHAYGIHLGQEDLHHADLNAIAQNSCRLGISTHSYTEVARALWFNPSYIALGPIYATDSKKMPWVPQGVAAVEYWVKLLAAHFPLVAIGGITLERARELKPTGVGSVAMITAITGKEYRSSAAAFLRLWK